jgi:hypothetical protein
MTKKINIPQTPTDKESEGGIRGLLLRNTVPFKTDEPEIPNTVIPDIPKAVKPVEPEIVQVSEKGEKYTVYIRTDYINTLRNLVYQRSLKGESVSQRSLVEEALEMLFKKENRGGGTIEERPEHVKLMEKARSSKK